jgi:phage terminase large subunit
MNPLKIKKVPVYLPDLVGKGYATFWHFKGRIRAVKGSRRSKKSKTMALWVIYNMMKHPQANTLVVRKTYRTLKDSCFTELKWAIKRLQVEHLWNVKESPLELTYIPTGQKVYFRGLDDPLKITSIAVEVGVLCWMWIEEAYEITSEDDFDTLAESMLGDCPEDLWKQITLTFNPWSDKIWIKKKFFDVEDPDVLAMTTNYKCNEWLSPSDRKVFEDMKRKNPRRYRVAGEGEWGVVDGLVYENWKEQSFTLISKKEFNDMAEDKRPQNPVFSDGLDSAFGLDFGYTNDPTALFCGFLSLSEKKLYVWDELYQKGLSNKAIHSEVSRMGYGKERITGDSAEPKSIDELRGLGLRIAGAKKGKDSVNNGIQWIQDLEIIIHPRCVNFLMEISTYQWKKDKFDKKLNEPEDDNNHLMDAMRYALEKYIQKNKWLY